MSKEWFDTEGFIDNLFRGSRLLGLTPGEVEPLLALLRCDCPDEQGQRKGVVWPSPGQGLHKITGRARRNIQRTLASLEAKGAITCLTPDNRGGGSQPHRWRINYQALGWKEQIISSQGGVHQSVIRPYDKSGEAYDKLMQGRASICRTNPEPESGKNPPPPIARSPASGHFAFRNPKSAIPSPSPPPSSRPAGSPAAPPVWEEEEFPFLSPDERTCLQSLQVSPALWQRVRQSEPGLVQAALQHLLSRREDILASGRSLEERFGGLLTGKFVPSPEPEPLREEVPPAPWCLCRACGVTYQGKHECSSLPEGREPPGEEILAPEDEGTGGEGATRGPGIKMETLPGEEMGEWKMEIGPDPGGSA